MAAPTPTADYESHLAQLTMHLSDAGIEPHPLTQAAVESDARLIPLAARVLSLHVARVTTTTDDDTENKVQKAVESRTAQFLAEVIGPKAAAPAEALLPLHALPLYYALRAPLLTALFPPEFDSVTGLTGPPKGIDDAEVERVLGAVYVQVSLQTHLVGLYGGTFELLAMLAGEDEDDEDQEEAVDAVADKDQEVAAAAAAVEVVAVPV
ncbi:hypothetical protein BC828DRAFT_381230 [Blastocladiella britannica]|nr:hypothetical protein BC828DRAFT_381230 [Blastocladiella britannica]